MIRAYALMAGLAGVVGDPFALASYLDILLAEALSPARPKEHN